MLSPKKSFLRFAILAFLTGGVFAFHITYSPYYDIYHADKISLFLRILVFGMIPLIFFSIYGVSLHPKKMKIWGVYFGFPSILMYSTITSRYGYTPDLALVLAILSVVFSAVGFGVSFYFKKFKNKKKIKKWMSRIFIGCGILLIVDLPSLNDKAIFSMLGFNGTESRWGRSLIDSYLAFRSDPMKNGDREFIVRPEGWMGKKIHKKARFKLTNGFNSSINKVRVSIYSKATIREEYNVKDLTESIIVADLKNEATGYYHRQGRGGPRQKIVFEELKTVDTGSYIWKSLQYTHPSGFLGEYLFKENDEAVVVAVLMARNNSYYVTDRNQVINFLDNIKPVSHFTRALNKDADMMEPSINRGAKIYFSEAHYVKNNPKRGDIIITMDIGLSRIAALPGETIDFRDGLFFINGKEVDTEYYPKGTIFKPWHNHRNLKIKPNHYFILPDNPNFRWQRKVQGPIHIDKIRGKILGVYDPPEQARRFD